MKHLFFFAILLMNGCSLSPLEQEMIDKHPECLKYEFRLSNKLHREEDSCIKSIQLTNEINESIKEKKDAYKNRVIQSKSIRESNDKKHQLYLNSDQGVDDGIYCGNVIKDYLFSRSIPFEEFKIKYYRRDSEVLMCTYLVDYKTVYGTRSDVLTIIYNTYSGIYKKSR